MRFLFLMPRLHNNYYESLKELRAHDHEVQAAVLYVLPTERHDLIQPIVLGYSRLFRGIKRLVHRGTTSLLKDRFELRYGFPPIVRLWRVMRQSRAEVVVVKNIDSSFSLLSLLFARLLRKKSVIHLQIEKYRKQPKSGLVAFADRWFDAKVITPLLGDPRYPNENDNLYYIPFSHTLDKAPEQRVGRTGPIRILCVAKFQARKNQQLLLQALQKMKPDFAYELHLVGQRGEPEQLERIQALIREISVEMRVSIRIDLSWSDMQAEYRWADLYVLPSAREPAAVSILEAMSFGLPVICSDQNGTKCYIVEGENGSVFRSGDCEDLVRALSAVAPSRERLLTMGARSRALVEERHSPEKTYESFMRVVSL